MPLFLISRATTSQPYLKSVICYTNSITESQVPSSSARISYIHAVVTVATLHPQTLHLHLCPIWYPLVDLLSLGKNLRFRTHR